MITKLIKDTKKNEEGEFSFKSKIFTNTIYIYKPRDCRCSEKYLMTGNRYVPCACYELPIMNALWWWLVAVCRIFTHSMGLVLGHKSKEMHYFLF